MLLLNDAIDGSNETFDGIYYTDMPINMRRMVTYKRHKVTNCPTAAIAEIIKINV